MAGQRLSPAQTYDVVIAGGRIYDGSGERAVRRGRRDQGRPHRRHRATSAGHGSGHPGPGPRGGAGFHQHAELGDGLSARGRAVAERYSPGRDSGGHGRRRVDGAAERRDEAGHGPVAGRPQVPRGVDHAGRVPRVPGPEGRLDQRRFLRGCDHGPCLRRRIRRSSRHGPGTPEDARAGACGDAGRGVGRQFRADLCSRLLCPCRGTDGPGRGGRSIRRIVHLASSQRGQPLAGGVGRVDRHGPQGERRRGTVSHEGRRPVQLGQVRRHDPEDREGPGGRSADHGRHVHLHGRRPRVSTRRCRPGSRRAGTGPG